MKIEEISRRDFTSETDPGTKERARGVHSVRYIGVSPDYTVYFNARSASGNGSYIVKIQLAEYKDIADDEDMTVQEKVRLALAGDLKVSCTCPAFRYWGFEYINSQLGTHAGEDQDRYPHIRNPKLTGVLCKHAFKAMQNLPMVWNSIASDIQRGKWMR